MTDLNELHCSCLVKVVLEYEVNETTDPELVLCCGDVSRRLKIPATFAGERTRKYMIMALLLTVSACETQRAKVAVTQVLGAFDRTAPVKIKEGYATAGA